MTARKRPWWVMSQSPARDVVLGVLWTVIAVFHWIERAGYDGDRAWYLTVGIMATLAAVGYATSATVRLRRKWARAKPTGRYTPL